MEMFNVIMKASNWKSQGIEIRTNCNAAVSHFKTKPWSKPFQLNVCETICHNIRSSSLLSYRFISLNYCPKCLIWDFWFRKLIVLLVVLLLRFNDDSVFFSFSFLLVWFQMCLLLDWMKKEMIEHKHPEDFLVFEYPERYCLIRPKCVCSSH